jgi:putative flippase GtrA
VKKRLAAFVTVGAVGFGLQLWLLLWLTRVMHWPYLVATLFAVEAAIVHNFLWHEHWTWSDRPRTELLRVRFVRFLCGTGLTSLAGNVVVTMAGVELMHLPEAAANALAVGVTSAANYLVADRWVFNRKAMGSGLWALGYRRWAWTHAATLALLRRRA